MSEDLKSAVIQLDLSPPDILTIKLIGNWLLREKLPPPRDVENKIIENPKIKRLAFNTEKVTDWDTGMMVYLKKILEIANRRKMIVDKEGLPKGVKKLLRLATAVPVKEQPGDPLDSSLLYRIGDISLRLTKSGAEMLAFLGEVCLSSLNWLRGKGGFRRSDFRLYLEEAGAQALPIVTLVNFLVGIILAFVGAIQLESFGASIFVADLVAIAMVREMGPMMTAIILAGRSGAAYAAQIGTMMVNEEIDALKTLGISPINYLVLPRLLALTIMAPLLALYGDFMGMIAGALVGKGMLGISFSLYLNQTIGVLSPLHFILGLIKACIYGGLVAFAGCQAGMQSGRSASAVGAATTRAVVNAIILIIVASAITTIIYSVLGI